MDGSQLGNKLKKLYRDLNFDDDNCANKLLSQKEDPYGQLSINTPVSVNPI
jgi:hypothetical protein